MLKKRIEQENEIEGIKRCVEDRKRGEERRRGQNWKREKREEREGRDWKGEERDINPPDGGEVKEVHKGAEDRVVCPNYGHLAPTLSFQVYAVVDAVGMLRK